MHFELEDEFCGTEFVPEEFARYARGSQPGS